MADLNDYSVFQVGGQRIIAMDLFNGLALACVVYGIAHGAFRRASPAGRLYTLFLAWIVAEVFLGATTFSGRAFGEFRYVAPLFWFFVPIAIDDFHNTPASVEGGSLALQTLGVAAVAGTAMFCVEVASGGRVFFSEQNREALEGFTDFRGVRYLDTYQAYNIMLAACLIAIRPSTRVRNSWRAWLIAAVLAIVAIWTRNRAAVVALILALVALAILQRRFRLVVMTVVGVAVSVATIALLSDAMMQQITHAFAGVLNPVQDDTGRWRLFLQLSAIEQGLKTPVFGQGYGGYYYFEVPGMEPIVAPPHNQYIEIFLKAGGLGLLLCITSLWAYAAAAWRAQSQAALHDRERLVLRGLILVIVSLIPYGLAYDFPPIFALLLGCTEVILQRLAARNHGGLADFAAGRNLRWGSIVPT